MSSRSKDLLSATLISAGIVGAAEIHACYTTGTTGKDAASRDYWADWFDNSLWHPNISTGLARCSSGRCDVIMLVAGDHYMGNGLTWNKGDTHLVGMGGMDVLRHNAVVHLDTSGTTMIDVTSSGCTFANFQMEADQDSTSCVNMLKLTTGSGGFTGRNIYMHGPEGASVAAATAFTCLNLGANNNYFENCSFGNGWPMASTQSAADDYQSLIRIQKSVQTSTIFRNCNFIATFTNNWHAFIYADYKPSGGCVWAFHNCNFLNPSTVTATYGIASESSFQDRASVMYFDANTSFAGVTDVAAATDEGGILFANNSIQFSSTGTALQYTGIAQPHDHT